MSLMTKMRLPLPLPLLLLARPRINTSLPVLITMNTNTNRATRWSLPPTTRFKEASWAPKWRCKTTRGNGQILFFFSSCHKQIKEGRTMFVDLRG